MELHGGGKKWAVHSRNCHEIRHKRSAVVHRSAHCADYAPQRQKFRACIRIRAASDAGAMGNDEEGDRGEPVSTSVSLSSIIRRKRGQIVQMLSEYSEDDLLAKLESEAPPPSSLHHRLAGLIPSVRMREGRPAVVVEVARQRPGQTSTDLAEWAERCVKAGADAIAVPTDALDTPTGLEDLLAVCRAVRCPVVRRDWILHPLQILEAKEAGAAGVLGIVTSILGKHAALYSSYAARFGLDCPVEVVNMEEKDVVEKLGVPFFGMNLGVGLSLPIPGFRSSVAAGLLDSLPFGASSLVGVTSMEEALKATEAKADMIMVKKEWLQAALAPNSSSPVATHREGRPVESFLEELKYATSGDS